VAVGEAHLIIDHFNSAAIINRCSRAQTVGKLGLGLHWNITSSTKLHSSVTIPQWKQYSYTSPIQFHTLRKYRGM